MASTTLTLAAILYFSLPFLSTKSLHVQPASEYDEETEYVLDTPFVQNEGLRTRRFLATVFKIKKDAKCDAAGKKKKNICNLAYANNGASLVNCCKKHCRDIYGDRNNCGACGHKCGFGQRCCDGECTDILRNDDDCGKCGRKCAPGAGCRYGVCGYA